MSTNGSLHFLFSNMPSKMQNSLPFIILFFFSSPLEGISAFVRTHSSWTQDQEKEDCRMLRQRHRAILPTYTAKSLLVWTSEQKCFFLAGYASITTSGKRYSFHRREELSLISFLAARKNINNYWLISRNNFKKQLCLVSDDVHFLQNIIFQFFKCIFNAKCFHFTVCAEVKEIGSES